MITTKQSRDLSPGSYDITPIPSGYLKYGWTSDPQRYAASREFSRQSSQAIAVAAAAQALAGVSTGAEPSSSASTTTHLATAGMIMDSCAKAQNLSHPSVNPGVVTCHVLVCRVYSASFQMPEKFLVPC